MFFQFLPDYAPIPLTVLRGKRRPAIITQGQRTTLLKRFRIKIWATTVKHWSRVRKRRRAITQVVALSPNQTRPRYIRPIKSPISSFVSVFISLAPAIVTVTEGKSPLEGRALCSKLGPRHLSTPIPELLLFS